MNEAFVARINQSEFTIADLMRVLNEKLPDVKHVDQTGKVVVVTGSNVGIGFETAKAIAAMNPAIIILACRNQEKAAKAVANIEAATGSRVVEAWTLDLASFASVRAFAERFNASRLALDVLVSNAGIIEAQKWVETVDNLEITMQVNHIANMLLVLLLTPSIFRAAHPRIVIVASESHFWAGVDPVDLNPVTTWLHKTESRPPALQYFTSKLFNVIFASEYARRCPNKNVWICSANPCYTESEFGEKDSSTGTFTQKGPSPFKKRTTLDGAKTIIFCATDPDVVNNEKGGFYSEVRESKKRSICTGTIGAEFGKNVWNDTISVLSAFQNELEPWARAQS